MRARSRLSVALITPLVAALAACGGDQPTVTSDTREGRRAPSDPSRQASTQPAPSGPAWSKARLLRHIAGEVVLVEGRRVRVDSATVTCGGVGPASRRGDVRVWQRFVCTQPTFPSGGVAGPDAVFRVETTGPRSLRITDTRFTRY